MNKTIIALATAGLMWAALPLQAETMESTFVAPVQSAQPIYPRAAMRTQAQGEVLVQYSVNTQGRAEDIKVLESSNDVFNDAAMKAVEDSSYMQTFANGQAVEVEGVVQRFRFVFDVER